MREPVTLAAAALATGRSINSLRHIVKEQRVVARACDVRTRALLFELWQVEAAAARRRGYRRRVAA